MAGLILLAAIIALITLLIWFSGVMTRWLRLPARWKVALRMLIVMSAFPLMLLDEIIGKYQFEALCKANGIESIDVSSAKGMRVKIKYGPRSYINGISIPTKESTAFFYSANDVLLFKHKDYYAGGGWLMRYTPISMGASHPMLFDGNGCGLHLKRQIFLKNDIVQVN
jgi:hypothetical protein